MNELIREVEEYFILWDRTCRTKRETLFVVRDHELANKYVKKTGNTNAQMYFSVDNPKEFAKYTNTKLLEVDGFFQKALKDCHGLKLSTKIYMYFADRWSRTLVVHLRFTE